MTEGSYDALPVGVLEVDDHGTVRLANRKVRELLGRGEASLEGVSWQDLFPRESTGPTEGVRIVEAPVFAQGKQLEIDVSAAQASPGYVCVLRDVTERVAQQQHLHLLEAAVEHARDAVIITDAVLDSPGPQIVFINPAFTQLTGWEAEEVLGKTPRILQGEDSDPTVLAHLRRDLEAGRVFHGKIINYRKNGEPFHLEWSVAPIHDADGVITHYVGIQRDVTRRERVKKLLLQARNEWEATVDAVSDLILLEDRQGRVLRCNQAVSQLLARGYDEILGRHLNHLFLGDADPTHVDPCFRKRRVSRRFQRWNRWFEIANYPLKKEAPRHAGWVHVLTDITARREAEQATSILYAAVEQAREAIIIADEETRVEYVNPAFSEMSGFAVEEVVGREIWSFRDQPREQVWRKEIVHALEEEQAWHGALPAQRKDGSRYLEQATISPVRNDQGDVVRYIGVCRDVTEQRRLEAVAEGVNMMENLGYIFTTLRHELGNPINSMKTALSVLRRHLDEYPRETVIEYLDRILEETSRVEYLLQTLRTFSMYETLDLQPVAPSEIFERLVKLLERDLSHRGIDLVQHVDPELATIQADPRALQQVLLNLATNAIDALEGVERPRIELRLECRGTRVELTVRDNGCGMTADQQEEALRPFYTTKEGGTGLGMLIVQKLVSKMQGTLELSSARGGGTTVCLSLPRGD